MNRKNGALSFSSLINKRERKFNVIYLRRAMPHTCEMATCEATRLAARLDCPICRHWNVLLSVT